MHLTQLSDRFFVSGQVDPSEMDTLSTEGFTTIICNRPDGEDPGQPTAEEVKSAAEKAGLQFYFVPFDPMNPNPQMVPDFQAAWESSEGKVLAYCRSGNRSSRLWAAIS